MVDGDAVDDAVGVKNRKHVAAVGAGDVAVAVAGLDGAPPVVSDVGADVAGYVAG